MAWHCRSFVRGYSGVKVAITLFAVSIKYVSHCWDVVIHILGLLQYLFTSNATMGATSNRKLSIPEMLERVATAPLGWKPEMVKNITDPSEVHVYRIPAINARNDL